MGSTFNWSYVDWSVKGVLQKTVEERNESGDVEMLATRLQEEEEDFYIVSKILHGFAWLSPEEREPYRETCLSRLEFYLGEVFKSDSDGDLKSLFDLWLKWPSLVAENDSEPFGWLAEAFFRSLEALEEAQRNAKSDRVPQPAFGAGGLLLVMASWSPEMQERFIWSDERFPGFQALLKSKYAYIRGAMLYMVAYLPHSARTPELLESIDDNIISKGVAVWVRRRAIKVLFAHVSSKSCLEMFGSVENMVQHILEMDLSNPETVEVNAGLIDVLPYIFDKESDGKLVSDFCETVLVGLRAHLDSIKDAFEEARAAPFRRSPIFALQRSPGVPGREALLDFVFEQLKVPFVSEHTKVYAADAFSEGARDIIDLDQLRAEIKATESSEYARALVRGFPELLSLEEISHVLKTGPEPLRQAAFESLLARTVEDREEFRKNHQSGMQAVLCIANKEIESHIPLARRVLALFEELDTGIDAGGEVPWGGLSLPCMSALRYHKDYFDGMTTAEMLVKVVLPLTKQGENGKPSSMVDLAESHDFVDPFSIGPIGNTSGFDNDGLQYQNFDNVRPFARAFATTFVSHSWRYSFAMVLSALSTGAYAHTDLYFWFDLFSVNQHEAPNRPPRFWSNVFKNAVGSFASLKVVLNNWESPIPLSRIWCIWEMFSALDGNKKVELEFPGNVSTTIWDLVAKDKEFVVELLEGIDVGKAEATFQSDVERILAAIDSATNLSIKKVNLSITGFFASFLLPFTAYSGDLDLLEKFIKWGAVTAKRPEKVSITLSDRTLRPAYPVVYALLGNHQDVLERILEIHPLNGEILDDFAATFIFKVISRPDYGREFALEFLPRVTDKPGFRERLSALLDAEDQSLEDVARIRAILEVKHEATKTKEKEKGKSRCSIN